eukprot:403347772
MRGSSSKQQVLQQNSYQPQLISVQNSQNGPIKLESQTQLQSQKTENYGQDKNKSQYHYWWKERTDIGVDFKPTKIEDPALLEKMKQDMNQKVQEKKGQNSAWNRAGTWEDKTLKKVQLQKILEGQLNGMQIRLKSDTLVVMTIKQVEVLDNSEGSIIMVRGKVKIGYELNLKLNVELVNQGTENCSTLLSIVLREVTDDEDDCDSISMPDFYGGRYDARDYVYIVCGIIFYFLILAPFCFTLCLNQNLLYDTKSSFIQTLFFREEVNTTYISFGNMFYQCAVYIVGWVYIRRINQRDQRQFFKILQKKNSYVSMIWLMLYAVFFFFTSGSVLLYHRYDMSEYCSDEQKQDFQGKVPFKEFEEQEVGCYMLSNEEIFKHNYLGWTLSVFVGMQFTHLSRSTFFGSFDFVGNIFLYWPLRNWFILFGILSLIVYTMFQLVSDYIRVHVAIFYGVCLLLIIMVNYVLIQYFYGVNRFHLHHYILGQMLVFFTCYQDHYIIFLNGIGTGIMLDGGSSFDWDPIFEGIKSNIFRGQESGIVVITQQNTPLQVNSNQGHEVQQIPFNTNQYIKEQITQKESEGEKNITQNKQQNKVKQQGIMLNQSLKTDSQDNNDIVLIII